MDPAELNAIVITVANTSCMILLCLRNFCEYYYSQLYDDEEEEMLNHYWMNIANKNTRLHLAFTEQLLTVDHCCWSQEMSNGWWDRIVMQVWDGEQCLQLAELSDEKGYIVGCVC